MEPRDVKSVVESILFVSSKPLSTKELAKFLDVEPETVVAALRELVEERRESGVVVLESNNTYQMATNSRNSTLVKNFLNQDLREKLTDATLEVLAIIAYRQPITKAEIEAIRGVNSQYSIRHLLMRGLIEKIPNPHDARGFLYQTTTEFLQHMGLNSAADLPEFAKLVEHIKLPETPQAKAVAETVAEEVPTEPVQEVAADTSVTPEQPIDAVVPAEPEQPVIVQSMALMITEYPVAAAETTPLAEPEPVPPVDAVEPLAADSQETEEDITDDEEDELDEDEDEDDEA